LLAVRSPARTYGFWRRGEQVRRVSGFEIAAQGPERDFRLELEGGGELTGSASRLRAWSVPIYSDRRPATHVRAEIDGATLVGTLNDFEPTWPEAGAGAEPVP
jgi:hypothetical protein